MKLVSLPLWEVKYERHATGLVAAATFAEAVEVAQQLASVEGNSAVRGVSKHNTAPGFVTVTA